ncbi:hypothetical protein CDL12_23478 [Handroanthus impetiginosus]|uniref:Ty3 transposon capsid-like protein domain-containing protein n=1 Tax=Handroanthus impetiginosus TaxID=429701 RepID=A0A2G9GFD0_9LAMI|nr:hypothetical protein CDL12_23478 [Handroanthus impetiginosus]
MAEGTRFKELQEQLRKQEALMVEERAIREANIHHLQTQWEGMQSTQVSIQQTLEAMQKQFQLQMHSITDQMHQYNKGKSLLDEGMSAPAERNSNSPLQKDTRVNWSEHSQTQVSASSMPKVEFPYFDGTEPRAWVRQSRWYFNIVHTFPEEQKVSFAVVHFRGKAELWFQNLLEERSMPSWEELIVLVMERFDDLEPALVVGELSRLQQMGTVGDYYERFEDLKSHVMVFHKELKESYFVHNFISGLKEEIKGSVLAAKPQTLSQAVSIAKQFESTIEALISRVSKAAKPVNQRPLPKFPNTPGNFSHPPKPPMGGKNKPQAPIRRLLTAAEMQARRGKNLCYNCDEVFVPGHRCKNRQSFFMMSAEEEEAFLDDIGQDGDGECIEGILIDDSKVSLNAMNGLTSEECIRLQGLIEGKKGSILIDSGSTRSFVDEQFAQTLNCLKESVTPLMVTVAGGKKLISRTIFPNLEWEIQGKSFMYPMRVVRIGGCDMVLGRKLLSLEEKRKLGGGYNSLLQTSLPEKFRCFDPAKETIDSSHRAFTTAFPRGFALEVLQVYSGPPEIVYKFRHWGFMEGPFKGHSPTGEMVEWYGMAVFELDEDSKIVKVEFFYDRGELLGALVKGDEVTTATGIPSSCPFLKNTG